MDEEKHWEERRAAAMAELHNDHFQFLRFMENLAGSCRNMTSDEVAALAEDYLQTAKKWFDHKRKFIEESLAKERGLPKDDGDE